MRVVGRKKMIDSIVATEIIRIRQKNLFLTGLLLLTPDGGDITAVYLYPHIIPHTDL